jgi:hypothetical protein
MPYTVQTEAARVAIAHRERYVQIERINGQIDASYGSWPLRKGLSRDPMPW